MRHRAPRTLMGVRTYRPSQAISHATNMSLDRAVERGGAAGATSIARVGVVDDEPAIRRVLRALLEKEGYAVTDFESGAALVEDGGAGLDALCLDLGLAADDVPGMDVIPHLRTQSPD